MLTKQKNANTPPVRKMSPDQLAVLNAILLTVAKSRSARMLCTGLSTDKEVIKNG